MSKRLLSSSGNKTSNPTVRLVDKEGSIFVGKYIGVRTTNSSGQPIKVYDFNPIDGDAPITIKDGKAYKEVDVTTDSVVSLFGTYAIDEAMSGAAVGEKIEFVFNGQKRSKNGRKFNDFTISVVE